MASQRLGPRDPATTARKRRETIAKRRATFQPYSAVPPSENLARQRQLAVRVLRDTLNGTETPTHVATELAGLVITYHEYRGWTFGVPADALCECGRTRDAHTEGCDCQRYRPVTPSAT